MELPLDQLTEAAHRANVEDEIPVLDVGPFLAGESGAVMRLAGALRAASETIGFHVVINHGVPQGLIDRVFAESARFHALPLNRKLEIQVDSEVVGYLPLGAGTSRSAGHTGLSRPNLNESFFMRNELPSDDPAMAPGKPYRAPNRWPRDLPGFKEGVLEYFHAMEHLAHSLLPVYAAALDMPPDCFDAAFERDRATLRLAHYPPSPVTDDQFGSAPHTDGCFMTFLAQAQIPGLEVYSGKGSWIEAPVIPGAFLVNSGDLLAHWTNGRFRSTPHRVINRSGLDRYSVPFFFNPHLEARIECLSSCVDAEHPPKYEPSTFHELYMRTRFKYQTQPPDAGTAGPSAKGD